MSRAVLSSASTLQVDSPVVALLRTTGEATPSVGWVKVEFLQEHELGDRPVSLLPDDVLVAVEILPGPLEVLLTSFCAFVELDYESDPTPLAP